GFYFGVGFLFLHRANFRFVAWRFLDKRWWRHATYRGNGRFRFGFGFAVCFVRIVSKLVEFASKKWWLVEHGKSGIGLFGSRFGVQIFIQCRLGQPVGTFTKGSFYRYLGYCGHRFGV